MSDQPAARSPLTTRPAMSAPTAVATEPVRLYQAYTFVRRSPGVTSVSDDCSIGRNGPTSAPEGLRTPIAAATSRTRNSVLPTASEGAAAYTRPAAATR